jgi:hypothetical protein
MNYREAECPASGTLPRYVRFFLSMSQVSDLIGSQVVDQACRVGDPTASEDSNPFALSLSKPAVSLPNGVVHGSTSSPRT